jgi:hypothetical protein
MPQTRSSLPQPLRPATRAHPGLCMTMVDGVSGSTCGAHSATKHPDLQPDCRRGRAQQEGELEATLSVEADLPVRIANGHIMGVFDQGRRRCPDRDNLLLASCVFLLDLPTEAALSCPSWPPEFRHLGPVAEAIEGLPLRPSQVVVLHYYGDLEVRRVAEILA